MGKIQRAAVELGLQISKASIIAAISFVGVAQAANPNEILRLMEQRRCPGCRLQDADLVHADLRGADLRKALLQRANLSRARLDGANLSGADLRFSSLQGASLRGANLQGALIDGADLRQADLSDALLDKGALARSHWDQALGIKPSTALNYAELHNAGVSAAHAGRYPEAEQFFNDAIRKQPLAAVSWIGRALCRIELGKIQQAANDLSYASTLYEHAGEEKIAAELSIASEKLLQLPKSGPKGNGKGIDATNGALAAFRQLAPATRSALMYLAPIARRALLPLPF